MKASFFLAMAALLGLGACHPSKGDFSGDPRLREVEKSIAAGNYDAAVSQAANLSNVPEGLYLEGYAMAYGWGDFRKARKPLEQLVKAGADPALGESALRLLADCDYWEGYYSRAMREYKKLAESPDRDVQDYAALQIAGCLLLRNQVGDAITAYRALVEKSPGRPAAEQAQLMIANVYLRIQNPSQAKTELQKLLSFSKNKAYQADAQAALRQLDAQAPFEKPGKNQ
ncbi:MAG TPA: tetratricopeptide repeat protein [bacterium]|nr:tetratricopeptide repeat protein [bacterium]